MDAIKQLIVGVSTSPRVVAAARALLLYAIPILATLLVGYLNTITDPRFYGVALACVPFVRALAEGLIDQIRKPDQNAVNPTPVAGGGGRDLID